jgi:hypothetical protein
MRRRSQYSFGDFLPPFPFVRIENFTRSFMPRLLLLSALLLLIVPSSLGQSVEPTPGKDGVELKKLWLLSELEHLKSEAVKLHQPLSHALANAEIADAAWTLDPKRAQQLLREAYELTFPDEEEQQQFRNRQVGAALTRWTRQEQARTVVRNRVLAIARRDNAFADQLVQFGAKQLGRYEENFRYAKLASEAVRAGDKESAGKYILQSIEAEPTVIGFGFSVLELAVKDRVAADKLILQYIERLREFPLSMINQSAGRVHFILRQMVFPSPNLKPELGRIPPAGSAVIRAHAGYVIESLSSLEQREPGSAQMLRDYLLSTWLPLNQHAPELIGGFLELEKLSRRPGDSGALPRAGGEETSATRYADQIKNALDSRQPDDLTIHFATSRGDFETARKLIELLPDGERKSQLVEHLNTREAMSLAAKGDLPEADRLAQQLKHAHSILQVYPAMIGKCVAAKDPACASNLTYQAMKQLKRAEDRDTVPLSLSRLAKSVAPVNELLALEVLDEAVQAANSSDVDTRQGSVGFELEVFRMLSPKNEGRVHQAATNLKDRLQKITALATIYRWKAKELADSTKATRQQASK